MAASLRQDHAPGYLQVGEGLQLTLAELPVVVPRSHLQGALAQWRDQVLAAVSILAAVLDERVAQRELLEDLIVYESTGSRPWASVDIGVRVRDFLPKKRVLSEEQAVAWPVGNRRSVSRASRAWCWSLVPMSGAVRSDAGCCRVLMDRDGGAGPAHRARETPEPMCAVLRRR
jgi:hypothetical protein